MSGFGDYKPAMAMFSIQFAYAGVALSTRAALLEGMNPRVFVVYRQAIGTLVIAPIAYFSRYLYLYLYITSLVIYLMFRSLSNSISLTLPSCFFSLPCNRRKSSGCSLGLRSFSLIFLAALIG